MKAMQIAVLGSGEMGSAVATALCRRTNHTVFVRGSRIGSPSALKLAKTLGIAEATDDVIAACDAVFVVVPADAVRAAGTLLARHRGLVVSISGSETVGRDGKPSCAEQLAAIAKHARVVHGFTSVWAPVMRDPGVGPKPSVFVCSDDAHAKATVTRLAAQLGFAPINAGALAMALYGETLGSFAYHLAVDSGYGQRITFQAFSAKASPKRAASAVSRRSRRSRAAARPRTRRAPT